MFTDYQLLLICHFCKLRPEGYVCLARYLNTLQTDFTEPWWADWTLRGMRSECLLVIVIIIFVNLLTDCLRGVDA